MLRISRLRRRAVALAAVTTTAVVALPAAAQADGRYCNRSYTVRGAIQAKYDQMGGPNSPLGCPRSEEKTTPNGRGKFTTFDGGSIYWTATTNAHPVWGALGDKWGALGWEGGALGFPTSDELTNADGQGKRQIYEGGTIYWHPSRSNGAHAVWGKIGERWGFRGWDQGSYGYPTGDETKSDDAAGDPVYRQQFEHGAISWKPIDYVALGDSYSSGEGLEDYDGSPGESSPGDCHRSPRAYAPLMVDSLAGSGRVKSFAFAACTGARTGYDGSTQRKDVSQMQMAFVKRSTDYVTLGIGGNDAKFADTLATCVKAIFGDDCGQAIARARDIINDPAKLRAWIGRTIADIRAISPDVTITLVGYPRLFGAASTCPGSLLSESKRQAMNQAGADMDSSLRTLAAAQNVRYASVDAYFDGHRLCDGDNATQWLHALVGSPTSPSSESFHPKPDGHRSGYFPAVSQFFPDGYSEQR